MPVILSTPGALLGAPSSAIGDALILSQSIDLCVEVGWWGWWRTVCWGGRWRIGGAWAEVFCSGSVRITRVEHHPRPLSHTSYASYISLGGAICCARCVHPRKI